ncbi:CCR4-NOT regulatory complex component [Rhizophlyctis rosea]|nr:CCR4-NOT regulatory complex component [Rhizophlyctis rosea]
MTSSTTPTDEVISVRDLNFDFGGGPILKNLNFSLLRGSRCLLVGANGAGKSTLLRILAGKRLVKGNVKVLGKNPFYDDSQGITYLGTEWAHNPIIRRELPVSRLLLTLGAPRNQERVSKLLDIMDVDPNWSMHEISDGQRRRVQIVLGLMDPWDVLLLDEVTVDLDVLARSNLLRFLKEETQTRNATILYATHIFDGLGGWPTHLAHMVEGTLELVRDMREGFPELEEIKRERMGEGSGREDGVLGGVMFNSPLLLLVEKWLAEDHRRRKEKEQSRHDDGRAKTRWDVLSDNMRQYGDKYYNYWREETQ